MRPFGSPRASLSVVVVLLVGLLALCPGRAGAQSTLINGNRVITGSINYCEPAGGTDSYACSLVPAIGAYRTGTRYTFKANVANTGAATLNLNGLGAKTIKKVMGSITTDLDDNDLRAGQMVDVMYDGTNMQLLSQLGNATRPIASGTLALATSAIASGACATEQVATATGVVTTDVVTASFNGDVTGVTGYTPATTGTLRLDVYPKAGQIGVRVCNATSASITPGSITLNYRVVR